MIRKILNYVFAIAEFYYYKFFYKNKKVSYKAIFLNLETNNFSRYLYIFLKFFCIEGYTIYVKNSFNLFYQFKRDQYASLLLSEKIIKFGHPKKNIKTIFLDESLLSPDYFSDLKKKNASAKSFYVPMAQHPLMYHAKWWNEPIEKVKRKKSLFIAGNFDDKIYSPHQKDATFNLSQRLAIRYYLDTRNLLYKIENIEQLISFLNNSIDHKIILINRLNVDIPMSELRNLLGKFAFYFALPGIVMPFSHNIVEAMSSGCIPFIQDEYAKLFKPQLLDGKQAIIFKNLDDLEERIIYLFGLSDEVINSMRNEVCNYYNSYLIPGKVVAEVEKQNFDKIYLQAESLSVELVKKSTPFI